MRRLITGGVIAGLSLLVPALAEEKAPFDRALVEAQRNSDRPGGRAFQSAVGKQFGTAFGPKLSACAKQVKKPDLRDLGVLVSCR